MDTSTPPPPEPDFMPRIRRLFAEGLPERMARMHRGLDGVAAAVAAGRAPSADDLEELFLPAHSLKGTAPGVGAEELGFEAGRLSAWIRDWRPDAPPGTDDVARARELLGRVEKASESARARIGGEADRRAPAPGSPGPSFPPSLPEP